MHINTQPHCFSICLLTNNVNGLTGKTDGIGVASGVFGFLVHSYGAVALFVDFVIAAPDGLRKRLDREDPTALKLTMWLFPWLSYATMALMLAVIVAMAILPDTQS